MIFDLGNPFFHFVLSGLESGLVLRSSALLVAVRGGQGGRRWEAG